MVLPGQPAAAPRGTIRRRPGPPPLQRRSRSGQSTSPDSSPNRLAGGQSAGTSSSPCGTPAASAATVRGEPIGSGRVRRGYKRCVAGRRVDDDNVAHAEIVVIAIGQRIRDGLAQERHLSTLFTRVSACRSTVVRSSPCAKPARAGVALVKLATTVMSSYAPMGAFAGTVLHDDADHRPQPYQQRGEQGARRRRAGRYWCRGMSGFQPGTSGVHLAERHAADPEVKTCAKYTAVAGGAVCWPSGTTCWRHVAEVHKNRPCPVSS